MQYILTDIEGTTTSVSFVYETLFPYFVKNLKPFVAENLTKNEALTDCLKAVQETVLSESGEEIGAAQAVEKMLFWTETDRKHTALKTAQGIVWQSGYEKGALKGHIFSDVPPVLEKWQTLGLKMGVYSSGSVMAQKLIFGFSDFGDLTPYFSTYFDTKIGHKREPSAYRNIAQSLQIDAKNILFLSDIEAELDAAFQVGFATIQLVRAGTTASQRHKTVADFSEIDF